MNTPTCINSSSWHLDRARTVLNEWYDRADKWLGYRIKFDYLLGMKGMNNECQRRALQCKTLGLVFHDRYALLLENVK